MQTNDFNHILSTSLVEAVKGEPTKDEVWAEAMATDIAKFTDNLPAGMRTPTAEEILAMKEYARVYMRQTPKASKREVRRAVLRKFPLNLLPNTPR